MCLASLGRPGPRPGVCLARVSVPTVGWPGVGLGLAGGWPVAYGDHSGGEKSYYRHIEFCVQKLQYNSLLFVWKSSMIKNQDLLQKFVHCAVGAMSNIHC